MAISITVGGQDYTSGPGYQVELPSVKVSEDILNDQWQMDFNIVIRDGAVPRPKACSEVIFTNGANREFAGVLATAKEHQIDPTTLRYKCIANNYQQWFDRHMVAESYVQQSADAIVKSMVSSFCPGFTTNNVQAAPVLPEQTVDYKAPSAAIRSLANMLAWQWYIDYAKDVHFFLAESIPSPLPGNALNADTDLTSYGDLVFEEDGTQVKNTIIAKDFLVMSGTQVPIHVVADGTNTTFPLPQQPAGTSSRYLTVLVGGTSYNVVPDIAQGMPGVAGPAGNTNAYISVGNRTVRFDVAPASGAVISGSMYYKYQPIYVQNDPALIQEQAALEGTDGIYEYAIQDPRLSADDTSLAQARSGYLLAKYGTPNVSATFKSYLQGWRAGQAFYLTTAKRMDGIDGQWFYVAKCDKTIVTTAGSPVLQYDLTISDRPFLWGGS